jgi:hypothetical protein
MLGERKTHGRRNAALGNVGSWTSCSCSSYQSRDQYHSAGRGRSTGFSDGYREGDDLCLAYEGEIETGRGMLAYTVLDDLFYQFNAEPPSDYRGHHRQHDLQC